ncbi:MAG: sulfotransferase [Coriobacteriia bacterium]
MLPDFIIVGAQKAATTFVQECLAEHPEVYLAPGETPFFESPDFENGDISDLEALFQGRTEARLGIKRPNYLAKPEVAPRIERYLPDAKLIAVLRNPVDRAVSAYFHYINYGFLPVLDIEVGMRRLLQDPSFTSGYPRGREVIEFGFYHRHLTRYRHFIDRGLMLILLFEDIVEAPLESMRKVYKHLGVSSDFLPRSLETRPQEVVYEMRRLRFLRQRNRFQYRYHEDGTRLDETEMSVLKKAIVKGMTLVDRHILARMLGNRRPRLSPGLRDMLHEAYESDIVRLEALIGRDLSTWRSG